MDESGDPPLAKSRSFNLEEKLKSKNYNGDFIKEMKGKDVNLTYFQENGFLHPLLIKDKTGLGMRVPSENFTVSDIKRCVGSRHIVDVMDTETEIHLDMSMKEWVRYYENKERNAMLNVTNLEFTNTKLATYVEQPEVVRIIDWVYHAWPWRKHEYTSDDTNTVGGGRYPKIQRFCIMTVAGSYTDFHIDMAGSSVWYHVLHGKKTLWIVPPNDENIELYKRWMHSDTKPFFADSVINCQRINIETGWTVLIPSGWIHAIYTVEDALSFSGNFLHSFSILDQLRIFQMETDDKSRLNAYSDFFKELNWYVLERYIHCLSGISHCTKSEEEIAFEKEEEKQENNKLSNEDLDSELDYFKGHPDGGTSTADGKKADTEPVNDPDSPKRTPIGTPKSDSKSLTSTGSSKGSSHQQELSKSRSRSSSVVKSLTVKLENCLLGKESSQNQTPTGDSGKRSTENWIHLTPFELNGLKAIVEYLENLPEENQNVPRDILEPEELLRDVQTMLSMHSKDNPKQAITGQPVLKLRRRKKLKTKCKDAKGRSMTKSSQDGSNFIRRRRVRCKKCEPCTRSECGECPFCKDMKKFGGLGRMKQTCISRQCMAPILPTAAVCVICDKGDLVDDETSSSSSLLMECGICWKILHPSCLHRKYPDLTNEGILNEDLPNSWECPKCCDSGKQGQLKPRIMKGVGFVMKQRHHAVMSSSEESDSNSIDQEKMENRKNLTSGKKPGSLKRKNVSEKDGTPKSRKMKSIGDERENERSPIKKIMSDDLSSSKDDKAKPDLKMKSYQPSQMEVQECLMVETSSMDTSQTQTQTLPSESTANEETLMTSSFRSNDQNGADQNIPHPTSFPPLGPKVTVTKYVVRPAPQPPPPKYFTLNDGSSHPVEHVLWIRIFHLIGQDDLARCMRVCKTWNRWCYDRSLWQKIDVSWRLINRIILIGIVRRQPKRLDVSWTNLSHRQLLWMLNRLPHLKHLNLAGNSWPSASSLCCSAYPYLWSLDLSWVSALYDECIRDLLSSSIDRRPGVDPSIRHLDRCNDLRLAGSDITNATLEMIVHHLTRLKRLDISFCIGIDDSGVEILSEDQAPTQKSLKALLMNGCNRLTAVCLNYIDKLTSLETVELQGCKSMNEKSIEEFVAVHSSCVVKWKENTAHLIKDVQNLNYSESDQQLH